MEQDKINAYMTLYTALVTLAKASAPMIPFMAESIYRNLVCSVDKNAPESVHLCDFPEVNASYIDSELEANMDNVLKVVVLARSARNGSTIKNRQPLSEIFVNAKFRLDSFYTEIIEDELNVKKVTFVENVDEFTSYSFKPQLKTVGPKYGKLLGKIRTALAEVNGNAAKATLDTEGALVFNFDGDEVRLTAEDLLIDIQQKSGYFTVADNGITVALDTNLTPELIEEGFVNEIVSKVQTMRKDSDFNVTDHITVSVSGNENLTALVLKNKDTISATVLADDIVTDALENAREWDINGEKVTIGVKRV
jgi:isoleucyl-tRNA synthetase